MSMIGLKNGLNNQRINETVFYLVINVQTNSQTTKLQIEVWTIQERVHNKDAQALINALDGLLARVS